MTSKIPYYLEDITVDDGMVRVFEHPHSTQIAHLESACCVSNTAMYYFICKYYGINLDGEKVVSEIAKLQDKEKSSGTYGNLRWYREQEGVIDTNAAFFGLLPVALAYIKYPDRLTPKEKSIIGEMLELGGYWFVRECKTGGYAYTNKEASSGAALMLMAIACKNDSLLSEAYAFWDSFLDYTEQRGWGWGENTSKCYALVTNRAFEVVMSVIEASEDLYKRLGVLRSKLLDFLEYHGCYEMVPTIRTYNYVGDAWRYGTDINESEEEFIENNTRGGKKISLFDVYGFILHQLAPRYEAKENKSSFVKEKVFDNAYAYSYKGRNIRLGVMTHFPVVPNCAQEKGWGLAWQSMPVAVCAVNHETSFLRFAACCDGKLRTHPTTDRHFSVVNGTELFGDGNIPDEHTFANQRENVAVVVRSVKHIANNAAYFADEYVARRFDGEVEEYNGWYILNYGDCVLAVKSVNGEAILRRDGSEVIIAQVYYEGAGKFIVEKNFITAWAIAVFDNSDDYKDKLDGIKVSFEEITDLSVPRYKMPFKVSCGEVSLNYDPDGYEFK
mgnify:CR=1 FL=1